MNPNPQNILTTQDCDTLMINCLGKNYGKIHDYQIKPFSKEVNGFLGDHLSIKVTVTKDNHTSSHRFFAKRFPFHLELQSQFAKSVGAFAREISVFEVLLKEFEKTIPEFDVSFVPKFYFGKNDDIVVFEDLSIEGYSICQKPNLNILDLEHIRLVLKALAKYHAGALAYEEIKSAELGMHYRLVDIAQFDIDEPIFRNEGDFLGYKFCEASLKGLEGIVDSLPENGLSSEEFKLKLRELTKKSLEIMKPQTKFRNVLCHGDLWAKNIMFKYEQDLPVDCKLVDFQLLRYFPPAHDVLMLLFITTNKEMRQHNFHYLLRFYHNCLKLELKKSGIDMETVLSMSEFKESVNYLLPQIKLQTAFQFSIQCGNPDFLKVLLKNDEEFKKFVFEDRTPFNLELFKYDENFKYLMTEALGEIREIVTIPQITREDCYKILNKKLGTSYYDFKSFQLIPCDEAVGFLGNYLKLKIRINFKNKDRVYDFFVKCMPQGAASLDIVMDAGMFHKETFIYDEFSRMVSNIGIGILDECIPKCYLAHKDAVEVFQDMSLFNYRALDATIPLNFTQLSVVLRKLGRLHATSLIFEEKTSEKTGRTFRLYEEYKESLSEVFYLEDAAHCGTHHMKVGLNSIPDILEMFPEVINSITKEQFLEKWPKLKHHFYEIIKPSNKYRNVICHGDLWTTNILFQYENDQPIDCCFVDFQCTRYCPPAHDFWSLMYLTTDQATRQENLNDCIEVYYRELSQVLEEYGYSIQNIYPYEMLRECLDFMRPQMIVQNMLYKQFTSCTAEEIEVFLRNAEFAKRTFAVDRRDWVREMCGKSEFYKKAMQGCIGEIYGICETRAAWQ